MLIEHTIRPTVNLSTGDITLFETERNPLLDAEFSARKALERHTMCVVRTRDEAVRAALIKLGWTPPPEPGIFDPAPENPGRLKNPVVFDFAAGKARAATDDEAAEYRAQRAQGRALGEECLAKAGRTAGFDARAAAAFMRSHLHAHGAVSSEDLVDAAKRAGHVPHDDRAFGPVIAGMARRGEIFQAGTCLRKRGNGTAGGRLWRISFALNPTNS